jgi:hypothetical protein
MVGVPSGWERLAAWIWSEPPSYPVAAGVLGDEISHVNGLADTWPTDEHDDLCGDFEEVPE